MHYKDKLTEAYDYVISRIVGSNVEPRPGLLEVVRDVYNGMAVLLSAPPGYGKTNITYTLSCLSSRSWDPWAPRVIHVLPLRSIVEDIYNRLFVKGKPRIKELGYENVAKQMLGYSESPFLQRTLVLTTIDTYLLTSIKIPPGDAYKIREGLSLGHGEYCRSTLLSSATIFDEIQLFTEESSKIAAAFKILIEWLSYAKTPLVIMSATIPEAVKNFVVSAVTKTWKVKVYRYGVDFKCKDFESKKLSNKITLYKTIVVENCREYVKKVAEIVKESREADKILIIANTVSKAVKVAKTLRENYGVSVTVLHGKIVSKDRELRLNRISKQHRWVLVTTQVVEAGVDISADMLITEVAPPSPLIQRAGRLLRNVENEEGSLTILYDKSEVDGTYYTVYPINLVNKTFEFVLENKEEIFWHLPRLEGKIGYEVFMEKVYRNAKFNIEYDKGIYSSLYGLVLSPLKSSKHSINILETLGSLVRDQPLVLGVVDFHEMFNINTSYEFKDVSKVIINDSFPLSHSDIKYLRKLNVPVLKFKKGKLICLRSKDSNLNDVVAFIIPSKNYNLDYGFIK